MIDRAELAALAVQLRDAVNELNELLPAELSVFHRPIARLRAVGDELDTAARGLPLPSLETRVARLEQAVATLVKENRCQKK